MTKQLLPLLLAALPVSACLSDAPADLAETDSEISAPGPAPIGTFEMRGDHIFYVGHDGSGYRAYELDASFALVRRSPAVTTSQPPVVENLTAGPGYVLFGDGTRNVRLSLFGLTTQTFDPSGVFGKHLRGNGGVTLRDGTITRLINGNGFGVSTASPVEVHAAAQPTAAAVMSSDTRAYAVPAGNYMQIVDVDTRTAALACKVGATYSTSHALATAHDQPRGSIRIAAKLTDGRLADCTRAGTTTSLKVISLPFAVGDVAFDGGGGIEFDGGGGIESGGAGLGIWVSSADTPELAYIASSGKVTVYPLSGKVSITPIPIPRVVRSFSDGSAAVLMSNGQFAHVSRW